MNGPINPDAGHLAANMEAERDAAVSQLAVAVDTMQALLDGHPGASERAGRWCARMRPVIASLRQ
jgi:hypothetical protein